MKLLISARDAGAAQHLSPVAKLASENKNIQLTIVASEPAFSILQSTGLAIEKINCKPEDLLNTAGSLLKTHQPHAILVGLSGPNAGIDEALLAKANNIKTFALQDFWGDVNNSLGRYADTYLVRDELAAEITQQRADVKTIVTGVPAIQSYLHAYDVELKRTQIRKQLKLNPSTPIISLCTQPLWQEDGYREAITQTLQALPHCHLLVRLHPRDKLHSKLKIQKLLKHYCKQSWAFSNQPLTNMLCASDLVLSAFSNCSIDLAHINRVNKKQASVPVYLMHNAKLHKLYKEWTGLKSLPLSDLGISQTIYSATQLRKTLVRTLLNKNRINCANASKQLNNNSQTSQKILNILEQS